MAVLLLAACSPIEPFDSAAHLRQLMRDRLVGEAAPHGEVPFELDDELRALAEAKVTATGGPRRRAQQVVHLIFGELGLEYASTPTRSARETARTRTGNCLSFVNLFVGLARHRGLDPFYVEVTDLAGWSYQQGMVVSHGHIVAGLRVDGELEVYDFLPYTPKSYRRFEPLGDLAAAAHYYNNLGAEALLAGDAERAERDLRIAERLAPGFAQAANNRGVALARLGRHEEALAVLQRGLAAEPGNVALLTNLARLYQQQGRAAEAADTLARIEASRQASPLFYVYQGRRALEHGDLADALAQMREALRRDSEIPEVHLGLVEVYLARGELEKARHHLGRALALDPSHREVRRYEEMLDG